MTVPEVRRVVTTVVSSILAELHLTGCLESQRIAALEIITTGSIAPLIGALANAGLIEIPQTIEGAEKCP